MGARINGGGASSEVVTPINLTADIPQIIDAVVLQRIGHVTVETSTGQVLEDMWTRINDTQIAIQASVNLTNLIVTLRK